MKRLFLAFAACLISAAAQAQTTQTFGSYVNGLPTATLNGSESTYVNQGGTSKKTTTQAIANLALTRKLAVGNIQSYVDSAIGSNSYDCLAATVTGGHGPCADLPYAWSYFNATYDGGGYTLTINLIGSGPYILNDQSPPWIGFSSVAILGAGSTTTEVDNLQFGGYFDPIPLGTTVLLDSMEIVDTSSGVGLLDGASGVIVLGPITNDWAVVDDLGQINFNCAAPGGTLILVGNGSVSGNGGGITETITSTNFCTLNNVATISIIGSPPYYDALANANNSGYIIDTGVWSGTPGTGSQKFSVSTNGLIQVNDADINWFPGDQPGLILDPTGSYTGNSGLEQVPRQMIVSSCASDIDMLLIEPALIINTTGTCAIKLPNIADIPNGTWGIDSYQAKVSATASATTTWATVDGSSIAPGFPTAFTAGQTFWPRYDATTNEWYP